MREYLNLLKTIKEKGVHKAAAREGMPGTLSIFGYQYRHDLKEGFPLLTTKKVSFKNVVTELLWFMKGDTNIKYLVDNGCNIWTEDAYHFYVKKSKENGAVPLCFNDWKLKPLGVKIYENYIMGDCGKQYGWLWRHWEVFDKGETERLESGQNVDIYYPEEVDQIKELIEGIRKNPLSRRHIITAWNPATLNDMALNACHAMVQFNCRPMSNLERAAYSSGNIDVDSLQEVYNNSSSPRYYLDCQLYQRSCDVILGCPYNIASYALLTHILCKLCNMIPGEVVHSFGDVHIYDNHMDAVEEQLMREPTSLPTLKFTNGSYKQNADWSKMSIDGFLDELYPEDFEVVDYNPQSAIKAKLSTGLQ